MPGKATKQELLSNFSTLLADRVRAEAEAAAKKAAESRTAFARLVDECARGIQHEPEKILKKLADWGISPAEFQSAFELRCDRYEWLDRSKTLPRFEAQLEDLAAKKRAAIAERDAVIQAAKDKCEAAVATIEEARKVAADGREAADQAIRSLLHTATVPEELQRRIDDAAEAVRVAEKNLERAESRKPVATVAEINAYRSAMDRRRAYSDKPGYAFRDRAHDDSIIEAVVAKVHPDLSWLVPFQEAVREARDAHEQLKSEAHTLATTTV